MRLTVVWLRPERWAMDRVLQCVASLGVDSSVSVITRSTSSSVTARGRPLRGSSDRPSNRRSKNRERHFPTVSSDTSKSAATAMLLRPLVQPRIILARSARPLGRLGATNPPFQRFPFGVVQYQRRHWPSDRHDHPSPESVIERIPHCEHYYY